MVTERVYQLEAAATDLRYAAGQLTKAADYLRRGLGDQAEDAVNRACEGMDRGCAVLCPQAEPATWTAEDIIRHEG